MLGFDFIKEVGSEYEADGWIPQEYTKKLLELNIIDDEYITTEDVQYGPPAECYWFDYAEDEFLEVFFNIVRYSLPYFQWTTRDLEEDTLYLLERAAYGFAYRGE